MKKILSVTIFTIAVILAVALVVFMSGSSQPKTSMNSTQSQTTTPPAQQSVTQSDLAKHNTQGDCWVSYKGKVYDLTAWLPKHPGSAGAIAPFCGTSSEFEAAFTGKHGTSQVETMMRESTYKGDLK